MLMGKKVLGTLAPMLGNAFVHSEFAWSWGQMIQYSTENVCQHGEIIHQVKPTLTYHAAARNDLVSRMLGDWILMLDCDHAFGPDLLERMLFLMRVYGELGIPVDVLSARYHYRLPPYGPLLYYWNDKKTGFIQIADWDPRARIFQVDSAGGGTLLVKRSVFERIYDELNEEPFSILPPFSEDHSFFVRLDKLGIKAFAAPNIQSLHLMTKPLGGEDYTDRMAGLTQGKECLAYDLQGTRV